MVYRIQREREREREKTFAVANAKLDFVHYSYTEQSLAELMASVVVIVIVLVMAFAAIARLVVFLVRVCPLFFGKPSLKSFIKPKGILCFYVFVCIHLHKCIVG